MLGHPKIALSLFHASLRTLSRLDSTRLLTVNHLDLAQGYLELGRSRAAIRHAERIKTALFLLGEAWTLDGDEGKARLFFEQLSGYYGDLPFIADLLLTVDVRQMINLGA